MFKRYFVHLVVRSYPYSKCISFYAEMFVAYNALEYILMNTWFMLDLMSAVGFKLFNIKL